MFLRLSIFTFVVLSSLRAQVVPADTTRLLKEKITSFEILNIGVSKLSGTIIKPGIRLDMAYNIQLYKHLGIKSMILYQNNQLNEQNYKEILINYDLSNSYALSTKGWHNTSAIIGVFTHFKITKNVSFEPRFSFGLNYSVSPEINITVTDSLAQVYSVIQKRKHSVGLCWLLGSDIKINVVNNFQIVLGVEGYLTALTFSDVRIENSKTNQVKLSTYNENITSIGFKIGLAKTL